MFHSAFSSTTSNPPLLSSSSGGQQPFVPGPADPGFRAPLANSLVPHRHVVMNGSGANRANPYPTDRPWLSPDLLGPNRPRPFDPMGPTPFGPFGGSELCLSRLLQNSTVYGGGANLPPFPVPTSHNPSASHHLLNPLLYPHLHQASPHLPFGAQRPFDPPYPLPRSRYLPLPATAPAYLDRSQSDSDSTHFRFPTGTPSRGPPRGSTGGPPAPILSKANGPPEPKRTKVSPGATQPYYPSHFMKGTVIQLANGELKRVEDLNTEDFVRSAHLTSYLKIDSSTVVRVEERSKDFVLLSFSVGEEKVQVSVEATLEHPFFVIGQGWSSCSPERTIGVYGLSCHKLQVGDICISLTHRDVPHAKDSKTPPSHQVASVPNGTATPTTVDLETNGHSPPGGDLKKSAVAHCNGSQNSTPLKISSKSPSTDSSRKELSRSQPPLLGSVLPRRRRVLPIVNPETGELCNEPTILTDFDSAESSMATSTADEFPQTQTKADSPLPADEDHFAPQVLKLVADLKVFWDSGTYDPRSSTGAKCYGREMMNVVRQNPVLKDLKPTFCAAYDEIAHCVQKTSAKDWNIRRKSPGQSMFAATARPSSTVSPSVSEQSDYREAGGASYPRWSDASTPPMTKANEEVQEEVAQPFVSIPRQFRPISTESDPTSSLDGSQLEVVEKSICQSSVDQLLEAVNTQVASNVQGRSVPVDYRKCLSDAFMPIIIETVAFAHRAALQSVQKKLETLQEKHADLVLENYSKSVRLAELESFSMTSAVGVSSPMLCNGSLMDGNTPQIRNLGTVPVVSDLISFDSGPTVSPVPVPRQIVPIPRSLVDMDVPVLNSNVMETAGGHSPISPRADQLSAANKKLTAVIHRIKEELADEIYGVVVDDEEIKMALFALKSKASTLKNLSFTYIVGEVKTYLSAKYGLR